MTNQDRRKRDREIYSITKGTVSKKRPRRSAHDRELENFDQDPMSRIYAIAQQNWGATAVSSSQGPSGRVADISLVSDIYRDYICSDAAGSALSALLETNYLERVLWPLFREKVISSTAKNEEVLFHGITNSIATIFVAGQRRSAEIADRFLQLFDQDKQAFTTLCHSFFQEPTSSPSLRERCLRTAFIVEIFRRFDHSCARDALEQLVSVPVWVHLSRVACQEQAQIFPTLRRKIQKVVRLARKRKFQNGPLDEDGLFRLLRELECEIIMLTRNPTESSLEAAGGLLTLFTDLLSYPKTRLIVFPLLEDRSTLPLVEGLPYAIAEQRSSIGAVAWARWIRNVRSFACFMRFPYDSTTGGTLLRDTLREKHSSLLLLLQSTVFSLSRREQVSSDHPIAFIPLSSQCVLRRPNVLHSAFMKCEDKILNDIRVSVRLYDFNQLTRSDSAATIANIPENISVRMLTIGALTHLCATADDSLEEFRKAPMMIHEGNLLTAARDTSKRLLSVQTPCLNIEFLSIQDYLLRNVALYKAEAASVIFGNLETVVDQLQPVWNGERYDYAGQSRVGLILDSCHFSRSELSQPNFLSPMNAKLEFMINFGRCSNRVRREWEELQGRSLLFFVKLGAPEEWEKRTTTATRRDNLPALLSNSKVRGVLIEGPKEDDRGTRNKASNQRKFTGLLDSIRLLTPSQMEGDFSQEELQNFDFVFRNPYKQSTLFPCLSTLRELLLSEEPCLPEWLEEILLGRKLSQDSGIGDQANDEDSLDFVDTFVSEEHLKCSFPGASIRIIENGTDLSVGPVQFHLRISRKESKTTIEAEPYTPKISVSEHSPRHDYGYHPQRKNGTKFDRSQIDAIRSGMGQGVTLLEGPPGTGKTSCVVQMTTNLFHGAANERTLIITHSRGALREVTGRILSGNVDPLRLVRLVHGAVTAEDETLSPEGRVNALLERRLQLLGEVARLAVSCLSNHSIAAEDWNCEMADSFYQTVVREKWQNFVEHTDQSWEQFPFQKFFSKEVETEGVLDNVAPVGVALQRQDPLVCYSFLASLFAEVEELRFLEVLRHRRQRGTYVLTTYSRIVAMTQAYAACHRSKLISDGFFFDTLIVEESTALLDVESFVMMVLQKQTTYGQADRLKRVVLLGDDRQEPRVHNEELGSICNLRQSMLRRLVRRGNKVIHLVQQGRSRKSISTLLRRRYPALEDRDHISSDISFLGANPGFAHTTQFIDTGDSDSEEFDADSIKNVVEAEFIAFVYIYMRLLGYPSAKIAVLTMHSSQVQLLQDKMASRLSQFPQVNGKCWISTIDDFQGHDASYVLLSLVRTTKPGKRRSFRGITDALSRARLGFYMFGYYPNYDASLDLNPLIEELPSARRLRLVANETFTECDRCGEDVVPESLPTRDVHSAADMAALVSHLYDAVTAGS